MLSKICSLLIVLYFICLSSVVCSEPVARREFDIWEYQVEGNTVLKTPEVQAALYPFLGVDKSIDIIETATNALEQLYKQKGYPLVNVFIPQQNVLGGVVRLQVIEGRVDRVKISGNQYFSRKKLRQQLPALKKNEAFDSQQVRIELDALNNSSPYLNITPVLRPGRQRGTMDVELKVKDKLPLSAALELNNRYTQDTSHLRLNASFGYSNLWQKKHIVSLSYQSSPERTEDVSVLGVTYIVPVSEKTSVATYFVSSDSEVGVAQGLNVIGQGTVTGVRGVYAIENSFYQSQSFSMGLDYKDFDETQDAVGSDNLNIPITYTGFSTTFSATDRDEKYQNTFSATASFGLRLLGNNADEFNDKRFLAKANYFHLRAGFQSEYNISDEFTFDFGINGQYTDSPLISNEQFSAGGVDTVRGYVESAVLGDTGLVARFNLLYDLKPVLSLERINRFTMSLFFDAARLHVLEPLNEQVSNFELSAAGAGVEAVLFNRTYLLFYLAAPLQEIAGNEDESSNIRTHFSLRYDF